MKYLILLLTLNVQAKTYTITYKNNLVVKVEASSEVDAIKPAAKICFQKLTGGVYPGEEKGLDIIDICVNPKEVK